MNNFPITFTNSNLKYKLIPRLINKGYIKRVVVGFNKEYGENDSQRGKAIYDCLKITKKGVLHVQELGTTDDIEQIRYFYKTQCTHSSVQVEERIKRTVLTDLMFDPKRIVSKIPYSFFTKHKSHKPVFSELEINQQYIFIPSIVCKRSNLLSEQIIKYINNEDIGKQEGKSLSSSKFYGIIIKNNEVIPVYNAGQYNVGLLSKKNEEVLVNKVLQNLGTCNKCLYLYQSVERIKKMIEQSYTESIWQKTQYINSVDAYKHIFLLPYGRAQYEYSVFEKIGTGDIESYYMSHKCFNYYDYIMAKPYVMDSIKNTGGIFNSQSEDSNYYIGYLPELRKLINIYRYYESNYNVKKLCIICTTQQKDFYEKIFSGIKNKDKLNFLITDFIYDGGE